MENVKDSFLIPILDGLRKSLPVSIETYLFSAFYREISKVRGEIGQSWAGISIRSVSGRSGVLRMIFEKKASIASGSTVPQHVTFGDDASGASPRIPGIYCLEPNPEDRSTSLVSSILWLLGNLESGCRTGLLQEAGRHRLLGSSANLRG